MMLFMEQINLKTRKLEDHDNRSRLNLTKDLTNKVFGKLTVISFAGYGICTTRAIWLCKCSFGQNFNQNMINWSIYSPNYHNPIQVNAVDMWLQKPSRNSSGVTGVKFNKGSKGYENFVAFWQEEIDGKSVKKSRSFSIMKYGYNEAFELACKARKDAITKLNDSGYGYTERHGK